MRIVLSFVRLLPLWLLTVAGCASVGNTDLTAHVQSIPANWRQHVYPFFLNSPNDPLRVTSFSSVSDYARDAGFANARYYSGFSSGEGLARDIRKIRQADPAARICLIGWSGASTFAFDAAKILAPENVVIDSVIYLDSQWIIDRRLNQQEHPQNIAHALLLYRVGHEPPVGVPHAQVFLIPTTEHLAVATHPDTVEYILRELIRLAGNPLSAEPQIARPALAVTKPATPY